jgi:putative ABC transport system permease protein
MIIGLAASAVGIVFGIAFAAILRGGFNAIGAGLPPTTLQIEPRSVVAGLLVGVIVTFVAAIVPAWRASRVPPMAAIREMTIETSGRGRAAGAAVLTAFGVAGVLAGTLAPLGGLAERFFLIGTGAVLLFIGAAMLIQYVARPLARAIGAPMARLGGLAGRLGRENAMRNPSRTSQTAAALTIGVALVTGVTIFAASLSETFIGTIDERGRADLVILASNQQPFSAAAAGELAGSPELAQVTAWRGGEFKDGDGDTQTLTGARPGELPAVWDLGVTEGSIDALADPGTIAVQEDYASGKGLSVGSELPALFARTGRTPLRVAAIFTDETFGRFFVSLSGYERLFTTQQDDVILARAAPGVSPEEAKAAAEARLAEFPNLDVRTREEYKELVAGQIDQFLRLFYVLLAMAVVIAIFGIVLTLALSVYERTREIGLLRAVGLGRRSVRAMIRWEAVIVSLIGALVGLALGVFLGAASVLSIPEFTALAIPWVSMLVFLLVAAFFGVLAAILPARRAARLNVLEAIQNE